MRTTIVCVATVTLLGLDQGRCHALVRPPSFDELKASQKDSGLIAAKQQLDMVIQETKDHRVREQNHLLELKQKLEAIKN